MPKELTDFDLSLITLSIAKDEYSATRLFTNTTGKSTEDARLYLSNLRVENSKAFSRLNRVEIIKGLDGVLLQFCNNSNTTLAIYVYSEISGSDTPTSENYVRELLNSQATNALGANLSAIRQESITEEDMSRINKTIRTKKYDKVFPGVSLVVLSLACYLFFNYRSVELKRSDYLNINLGKIQEFEQYSEYAAIGLVLGIVYTIFAFYLAKNNKTHWLD